MAAASSVFSHHPFPTSASHSGAHSSPATTSSRDASEKATPYTMQDVDGMPVPLSPELQEMLDSLFVPEEPFECAQDEPSIPQQFDCTSALKEHAPTVAGAKGGSVQQAGQKYFRKVKEASRGGGKSSTSEEAYASGGCLNISEIMEDDNEYDSDEGDIKPFYLKNLPDNRVSELFEQYERRYWELKSRGLPMSNKFFRSPPMLTAEERKQFYRYAQRFTCRMPEQKAKKRERNRKYKMRRFGRQGEKTEVQSLQTRISSLRTCLTRRLTMILAGHVGDRGRTKWTEQNSEMLMLLDETSTLAYSDPIYQMYEEMLRSHPQIPRCIPKRVQQGGTGREEKQID